MKSSSNRRGSDIPMFETIAELPLLRGASMARISEVCGQLKIRFSKVAPGEAICKAGQECSGLLFVLSGEIKLIQEAEDFSIEQTLDAPQVISPEHLFGLSTAYPYSVSAISSASCMTISKEDYRRMLSMDPVFLFNYLNTLSANAQRSRAGLLAIAGGCNPLERVGYWIDSLVLPGARNVVIRGIEREPHQIFGISVASMRSVAEKIGAELSADSLRLPNR